MLDSKIAKSKDCQSALSYEYIIHRYSVKTDIAVSNLFPNVVFYC